MSVEGNEMLPDKEAISTVDIVNGYRNSTAGLFVAIGSSAWKFTNRDLALAVSDLMTVQAARYSRDSQEGLSYHARTFLDKQLDTGPIPLVILGITSEIDESVDNSDLLIARYAITSMTNERLQAINPRLELPLLV